MRGRVEGGREEGEGRKEGLVEIKQCVSAVGI